MSLLSLSEKPILAIPTSRLECYQNRMQNLSAWDYLQIMEFFKNLLDGIGTEDFVVSSYVGSLETPWKPPLESIYCACRGSIQEAGFFFGLLFWEAIIKHKDTWFFKPADDVDGKVYFRDRRKILTT